MITKFKHHISKPVQMNRGKYRIAHQINNRGIFAEIEIEAALNVYSFGIQIEYQTDIARVWQAGIEFGIHYFIEHLRIPYAKGIHVKVIKFNYNDVDTTLILTSIVTVKALVDALNASIYKEPFVDTENSIYCFPF